MNRFGIFILLEFLVSSCTENSSVYTNVMAKEPSVLQSEKTAVFAEGCFWHSELVFASLEGVREVIVGYTGGKTENPIYEQVSSGLTEHAEAVKVYYDPSKISYATLVQAFFASHDPTSLNRQGFDEGTQYRSAAFYENKGEKIILEKTLDSLEQRSVAVVTEIKPSVRFYPAEEFHQDYALKNPEDSYVKHICKAAFYDFKFRFKGKFKSDSSVKN